MIPFQFYFLLLLSAASIISSLIDGEEIDNRKEIAKKDAHDDGPLSRNKKVNRTYKASTIPSQNMEAYMSTVRLYSL